MPDQSSERDQEWHDRNDGFEQYAAPRKGLTWRHILFLVVCVCAFFYGLQRYYFG